jgi:hypothetical protein
VSEEFGDDASFSTGICKFCPFCDCMVMDLFLVLLFFLFYLEEGIIFICL